RAGLRPADRARARAPEPRSRPAPRGPRRARRRARVRAAVRTRSRLRGGAAARPRRGHRARSHLDGTEPERVNVPDFSALILAGRRGPQDPLAVSRGATHRALLPVAGVPMLVRVVRALRAAGLA